MNFFFFFKKLIVGTPLFIDNELYPVVCKELRNILYEYIFSYSLSISKNSADGNWRWRTSKERKEIKDTDDEEKEKKIETEEITRQRTSVSEYLIEKLRKVWFGKRDKQKSVKIEREWNWIW